MASLIRMSDAASLALHATSYLAYYHPQRISNHVLASAFNASEAHLSKVLQRLSRNGIVRSIRGPHGGFTLAKAPQEITLLEVYEAIEGPLDASTCLLGEPVCTGQSCIMGDILRDIYLRLHSYLSSTTLAYTAKVGGTLTCALAAPAQEKADEE